MKKYATTLIIACICLCSCNSNTPRQYFEQAVLNCNYLYGFAGKGMHWALANPSTKLVDKKTMATVHMTRTEVVNEKLATAEVNFEKLKDLSATDDTQQMLTASIALHEFVLPVYKNEYMRLAALYDAGEPVDKIEAMEKMINEKYAPRFSELYNAAWVAGKTYADKNGIRVKEVNPTPPQIGHPE